MTSEEAAVAVIDALDELAIPYVLVGSLASNTYGVVRSTQDADFMIQFEPDSFKKLSIRLASVLKIDPQMQFESITMSVKHEATVIGTELMIEFFHLSDDEFQQERFRRRLQANVYGRTVYLPTVEDVIVMKSRWARPKDRMDLEHILAVQGDAIDWPYVNTWADKHGTRQLLDEIRANVPKI